MKKVIALIACVTPFLFGPLACRSQVNPTGPVYTAPVAGNGAYTPLNPVGGSNPPTTALNYTDSPSGEVAYVVQGYLPASGSTPAQYGPWSNVAGPVQAEQQGKYNSLGLVLREQEQLALAFSGSLVGLRRLPLWLQQHQP